MPRYLIEVEHENSKAACDRAVAAFLATGSHFMTNADWGCGDDVHKAWIIVDLDSKEQARSILPPLFREKARIIALQQFSLKARESMRAEHEDRPQPESG
jgi:hypothetical protein